MTGGRGSRTGAVLLAALLIAAAGCGLPGGGEVRTVDDGEVPYRLLDQGGAETPTSPSPSTPADLPVVLWTSGDRLLPEAAGPRCDEAADVLVDRLLSALAAGPSEEARAAGRSSALRPDVELASAGVSDGTVEVSIEADAAVSTELLPLAVGQIVLSVTSVPGVDSVVLLVDEEPVQVPLPAGTLTAGPVTASDYSGLVPDRFQRSGSLGCVDG